MAKTPAKTTKKISDEASALVIPKEIISYRLTNFDRGEIRDRTIKASFDPRNMLLSEDEDRLARKAYAIVFPAPIRKQAAALPAAWLRHDTCLRFNAGGMDVRLRVLDPLGLPVPHTYSCQILGSITDETIVSAIRAHMDSKEEFKAEKSRASDSLSAMLRAVNTLLRLADTWPEGYPFYAHLNKVSPIRVPALRVSELNEMLGLPPMLEAA